MSNEMVYNILVEMQEEREAACIVPPYVLFPDLCKRCGFNVEPMLDGYINNGAVIRHETINGYSLEVKR